ncbi:hypothetical protein AB6A40_001345 [Gnathostoma spinigerum]|uniref:Uncharacterized protein n=1 Tax=Gnathostoma spinigerum TaxID=75299 RepID=A0ABD6EB48_9BILA
METFGSYQDQKKVRIQVSPNEMSDIFKTFRKQLNDTYWDTIANDSVCEEGMNELDRIIIYRGCEPSVIMSYLALVREVFSHLSFNIKSRCLDGVERRNKLKSAWMKCRNKFIRIKLAMEDCWTRGNEPDLLVVYLSLATLFSLYKEVADEADIQACYSVAQDARRIGQEGLTDYEWVNVEEYCDAIEHIYFLRNLHDEKYVPSSKTGIKSRNYSNGSSLEGSDSGETTDLDVTSAQTESLNEMREMAREEMLEFTEYWRNMKKLIERCNRNLDRYSESSSMYSIRNGYLNRTRPRDFQIHDDRYDDSNDSLEWRTHSDDQTVPRYSDRRPRYSGSSECTGFYGKRVLYSAATSCGRGLMRVENHELAYEMKRKNGLVSGRVKRAKSVNLIETENDYSKPDLRYARIVDPDFDAFSVKAEARQQDWEWFVNVRRAHRKYRQRSESPNNRRYDTDRDPVQRRTAFSPSPAREMPSVSVEKFAEFSLIPDEASEARDIAAFAESPKQNEVSKQEGESGEKTTVRDEKSTEIESERQCEVTDVESVIEKHKETTFSDGSALIAEILARLPRITVMERGVQADLSKSDVKRDISEPKPPATIDLNIALSKVNEVSASVERKTENRQSLKEYLSLTLKASSDKQVEVNTVTNSYVSSAEIDIDANKLRRGRMTTDKQTVRDTYHDNIWSNTMITDKALEQVVPLSTKPCENVEITESISMSRSNSRTLSANVVDNTQYKVIASHVPDSERVSDAKSKRLREQIQNYNDRILQEMKRSGARLTKTEDAEESCDISKAVVESASVPSWKTVENIVDLRKSDDRIRARMDEIEQASENRREVVMTPENFDEYLDETDMRYSDSDENLSYGHSSVSTVVECPISKDTVKHGASITVSENNPQLQNYDTSREKCDKVILDQTFETVVTGLEEWEETHTKRTQQATESSPTVGKSGETHSPDVKKYHTTQPALETERDTGYDSRMSTEIPEENRELNSHTGWEEAINKASRRMLQRKANETSSTLISPQKRETPQQHSKHYPPSSENCPGLSKDSLYMVAQEPSSVRKLENSESTFHNSISKTNRLQQSSNRTKSALELSEVPLIKTSSNKPRDALLLLQSPTSRIPQTAQLISKLPFPRSSPTEEIIRNAITVLSGIDESLEKSKIDRSQSSYLGRRSFHIGDVNEQKATDVDRKEDEDHRVQCPETITPSTMRSAGPHMPTHSPYSKRQRTAYDEYNSNVILTSHTSGDSEIRREIDGESGFKSESTSSQIEADRAKLPISVKPVLSDYTSQQSIAYQSQTIKDTAQSTKTERMNSRAPSFVPVPRFFNRTGINGGAPVKASRSESGMSSSTGTRTAQTLEKFGNKTVDTGYIRRQEKKTDSIITNVLDKQVGQAETHIKVPETKPDVSRGTDLSGTRFVGSPLDQYTERIPPSRIRTMNVDTISSSVKALARSASDLKSSFQKSKNEELSSISEGVKEVSEANEDLRASLQKVQDLFSAAGIRLGSRIDSRGTAEKKQFETVAGELQDASGSHTDPGLLKQPERVAHKETTETHRSHEVSRRVSRSSGVSYTPRTTAIENDLSKCEESRKQQTVVDAYSTKVAKDSSIFASSAEASGSVKSTHENWATQERMISDSRSKSDIDNLIDFGQETYETDKEHIKPMGIKDDKEMKNNGMESVVTDSIRQSTVDTRDTRTDQCRRTERVIRSHTLTQTASQLTTTSLLTAQKSASETTKNLAKFDSNVQQSTKVTTEKSPQMDTSKSTPIADETKTKTSDAEKEKLTEPDIVLDKVDSQRPSTVISGLTQTESSAVSDDGVEDIRITRRRQLIGSPPHVPPPPLPEGSISPKSEDSTSGLRSPE